MEEIICDLSIWYNIANGNIKPEQLNNKKLFLVGLAVEELITSENRYYTPKSINEISNWLKLNKPDFIFECPFDYLYNTIPCLPTLNIETSSNQLFLSYLQVINQEIVKETLSNQEYLEIILQHDNKYKLIAERLNKILTELHKIKNNLPKSNIRKIDLKANIKNMVKEIVENRYLKTNVIPDFLFPFEHIEFFTLCFQEYLIESILQHNLKLSKNDIYDILYWLYISKDKKFWTRDKKWINLFKKNKDASNYLIVE